MTILATPFPYFGGKALVADKVWCYLGDVRHYIEPFCGSGSTGKAADTRKGIGRW